MYKGLFDNIEDLYKKSKDNKSGTVTSQLAYKVDRIAAGLQLTLKFDDEHSRKISENFRDLYRHVRFSMKMIYEKQEYKFLESSKILWRFTNLGLKSSHRFNICYFSLIP